MPDADNPAVPNGTADPYLLRDLIWCGLCDRAMTPLLLGRVRYYECENDATCPRPVLARDIELLVWQQYARLFEGTEQVVATAARRNALRHQLTRVRIGEDLFEVWCEWKD